MEKRKNAGIHLTIGDTSLVEVGSLLFYEGDYHLFYEISDIRDKNCFRHIKSSDLLNWQAVSATVTNDVVGNFSKGSIVVDVDNTSHLGENNSPLVAIYPSGDCEGVMHNQHKECLKLLYSNDGGVNWKEHQIKQVTSDTYFSQINAVKVVWHEETQKWIMLVLSGYEIDFYNSDNLIDWEYLSHFGDDIHVKKGNWNKLDFFPLKVNGTNRTEWVLFISNTSGSPNDGGGIQYFTGDFDGFIYKTINDKPKWVDNGSDVNAGIVLSNHIRVDKPAYFIGNIYSSQYFNPKENEKEINVFSLPRKLALENEFNGLSLFSLPVDEINSFENKYKQIKEIELSGKVNAKKPIKLPLEINLKFNVNDRLYLGMAEVFGIKLSTADGEQLLAGYHAQKGCFFIFDPNIGLENDKGLNGFYYVPYVNNENPTIDIKIIVDNNSVELFGMNGLVSLTKRYSFEGDAAKITFYAEDGNITLKEGNIQKIERISNVLMIDTNEFN